jgi:dipeptidyl aminopeptidase/acylaminoacyl peptidase
VCPDYTALLPRYKREDGLDLTATLYLPPGYDRERDGRLPCILSAYPREFKSAVRTTSNSKPIIN